MNRIVLIGRLVRDVEVRYTPNGRVVAQFTIAVDRPYLNQEGQKEADFIPVVMWGKQAETLGNTVQKGQRVAVEGRLQIRSYDAKDGSKKYVTEVIADHFEYIEKKGDTPKANGQKSSQTSYNEAPEPMPFNEEIPF